MTVKQLKDELARMAMIFPNFDDFEVRMVGYDIDGERHYDIPVKDTTSGTSHNSNYFTLWDR